MFNFYSDSDTSEDDDDSDSRESDRRKSAPVPNSIQKDVSVLPTIRVNILYLVED